LTPPGLVTVRKEGSERGLWLPLCRVDEHGLEGRALGQCGVAGIVLVADTSCVLATASPARG
jgi:hypothetical protein